MCLEFPNYNSHNVLIFSLKIIGTKTHSNDRVKKEAKKRLRSKKTKGNFYKPLADSCGKEQFGIFLLMG